MSLNRGQTTFHNRSTQFWRATTEHAPSDQTCMRVKNSPNKLAELRKAFRSRSLFSCGWSKSFSHSHRLALRSLAHLRAHLLQHVSTILVDYVTSAFTLKRSVLDRRLRESRVKRLLSMGVSHFPTHWQSSSLSRAIWRFSASSKIHAH